MLFILFTKIGSRPLYLIDLHKLICPILLGTNKIDNIDYFI